jgi:hypothetical protein
MYARGPPNTGDQHPKTGKEKQPRNGAAWTAPSRKSGRRAGATLAPGKLSATCWKTNIEICSINVELLNRTGSFDDPAWIERRSLAARTRLDATTDPVLLPGCRKIVRKWNEEIMRFQATVRVKSRMACGNQAAAEAAWREFVGWMHRPDRKALTGPDKRRTPCVRSSAFGFSLTREFDRLKPCVQKSIDDHCSTKDRRRDKTSSHCCETLSR